VLLRRHEHSREVALRCFHCSSKATRPCLTCTHGLCQAGRQLEHALAAEHCRQHVACGSGGGRGCESAGGAAGQATDPLPSSLGSAGRAAAPGQRLAIGNQSIHPLQHPPESTVSSFISANLKRSSAPLKRRCSCAASSWALRASYHSRVTGGSPAILRFRLYLQAGGKGEGAWGEQQ
jgi:hypothetical protein